jgi:hypothetical protein
MNDRFAGLTDQQLKSRSGGAANSAEASAIETELRNRARKAYRAVIDRIDNATARGSSNKQQQAKSQGGFFSSRLPPKTDPPKTDPANKQQQTRFQGGFFSSRLPPKTDPPKTDPANRQQQTRSQGGFFSASKTEPLKASTSPSSTKQKMHP